jgi:hypothetical protein
MPNKIQNLIYAFNVDVGAVHWTNVEKKKFANVVARELIVDFYQRYLDVNSNEDITAQVERYIKDQLGVEQ